MDNYVGNKMNDPTYAAEYKWWKRYDDYKRLSKQRYADPMLKQLWESLESRQELMKEHTLSDESEFTWGQTKEEFLILFQELIDGNINSIANTYKRIDAGEFVDDMKCVNGKWIDMKAYYEDIINANEEQIAGMMVLADNNPKPHITEKINTLKRINTAMRKKITTNRLTQPVYRPEQLDKNTETTPELKRSEQARRKKETLNNKANELAAKLKELEKNNGE